MLPDAQRVELDVRVREHCPRCAGQASLTSTPTANTPARCVAGRRPAGRGDQDKRGASCCACQGDMMASQRGESMLLIHFIFRQPTQHRILTKGVVAHHYTFVPRSKMCFVVSTRSFESITLAAKLPHAVNSFHFQVCK
jgi:hypothetical protein